MAHEKTPPAKPTRPVRSPEKTPERHPLIDPSKIDRPPSHVEPDTPWPRPPKDSEAEMAVRTNRSMKWGRHSKRIKHVAIAGVKIKRHYVPASFCPQDKRVVIAGLTAKPVLLRSKNVANSMSMPDIAGFES